MKLSFSGLRVLQRFSWGNSSFAEICAWMYWGACCTCNIRPIISQKLRNDDSKATPQITQSNWLDEEKYANATATRTLQILTMKKKDIYICGRREYLTTSAYILLLFFVVLPNRWYQFNARTVRTPFTSIITWKNQEMIAEVRRRRFPCLSFPTTLNNQKKTCIFN